MQNIKKLLKFEIKFEIEEVFILFWFTIFYIMSLIAGIKIGFILLMIMIVLFFLLFMELRNKFILLIIPFYIVSGLYINFNYKILKVKEYKVPVNIKINEDYFVVKYEDVKSNKYKLDTYYSIPKCKNYIMLERNITYFKLGITHNRYINKLDCLEN